MYALDTNCILRWLLWDNEQQAQTVDNYLKTSKNRLHVADLAIAELVWVLSKVYKLDAKLVVQLVRKVLEHENIACNRALFDRALDAMDDSPKASFVDICLTQYAGLADVTLLTFDKTLAKRFPRQATLAKF